MNYHQLQQEIETYVVNYFNDHHRADLVYHNLAHTKRVVQAAVQIANHYQLKEVDFFIVYASAWFHDTGYFIENLSHEEKGAEHAVTYLSNHQVDEKIVAAVKSAILSTRLPQSPTNLNEQILCDADLFHLGSDDFSERSKLLHKEVERLCNKEISKKSWRLKDIEFLEKHEYHTDYCRLLLEAQKSKNLAKLKKKFNEDILEQANKEEDKLKHDKKEKADKPAKEDKDALPSKGVETMFRITSANNQRLSDMADNKAQLLITVNSIILSLIVSLLLRRLEDNAYLVVPTFILLLVSLSCIVFSILATRPSIPKGVFTKEDVDQKRVNLVFFGNFYKMPLDEYHHSMEKVMADRDFLYGTLIKDVYSQGVVLGRKYKLIRIAYNIFMFGLITSVLAYILFSAIYGKF
ncbi:Pycsar system effector family protein [Pedobacter chitinilyticus]|uniref:HD domain-containing protein n=1 Tax=Pedobacter chitinilyticus TaxID=2233776 RepID=A0A3S3PM07_9SPHI|nr:Pycsar system effector family protein [Pedobacter chitinilyticus]RWU03875.1 HD domain-containing protein [Pedobacter chitinilyticus]